MKMFCDNPLCLFHVMVKFEMREMEIEYFGRRIRAEQHRYENQKGNKVLHLCSICYKAVELMVKN